MPFLVFLESSFIKDVENLTFIIGARKHLGARKIIFNFQLYYC